MCYSDHNEDIRTKGTCDYCGSNLVQHNYNVDNYVMDKVSKRDYWV